MGSLTKMGVSMIRSRKMLVAALGNNIIPGSCDNIKLEVEVYLFKTNTVSVKCIFTTLLPLKRRFKIILLFQKEPSSKKKKENIFYNNKKLKV